MDIHITTSDTFDFFFPICLLTWKKVSKFNKSNEVIYLNQTPYLIKVVAKRGSKNKHQKDTCLNNIEICIENVLGNLGSTINRLRGYI